MFRYTLQNVSTYHRKLKGPQTSFGVIGPQSWTGRIGLERSVTLTVRHPSGACLGRPRSVGRPVTGPGDTRVEVAETTPTRVAGRTVEKERIPSLCTVYKRADFGFYQEEEDENDYSPFYLGKEDARKEHIIF